MTHSLASLHLPQRTQTSASNRAASVETGDSGISFRSARNAPIPTRRHAFGVSSVVITRASSLKSNTLADIGSSEAITRPNPTRVAVNTTRATRASEFTVHNRAFFLDHLNQLKADGRN